MIVAVENFQPPRKSSCSWGGPSAKNRSGNGLLDGAVLRAHEACRERLQGSDGLNRLVLRRGRAFVGHTDTRVGDKGGGGGGRG